MTCCTLNNWPWTLHAQCLNMSVLPMHWVNDLVLHQEGCQTGWSWAWNDQVLDLKAMVSTAKASYSSLFSSVFIRKNIMLSSVSQFLYFLELGTSLENCSVLLEKLFSCTKRLLAYITLHCRLLLTMLSLTDSYNMVKMIYCVLIVPKRENREYW